MQSVRTVWQLRLRPILPYALLTAVLAGGLIGLDRMSAAQSGSTASSDRSFGQRGINQLPACGSQLGIVGYDVTLSTASDAEETAQTALGLKSSDIASEFLPLTNAAPGLASDPAAASLALDRAREVHTVALGPMNQGQILAKLQGAAGVSAAEPIYLQSTDKAYLACDYKLNDNATDQALAATARQALVTQGISAATLDDAATMEFVSIRHFSGRTVLQVAFVRRPVGSPSMSYVVLLDMGTRALLATAQADWYRWEQ
jgi:hypothetical protein